MLVSVEAAEEKLVDATEQAINLMRSVLENPEPIKNLHALLQAQQAFYAEASEAIQSVLGEVEEAGTAAEADWRYARAGGAPRFPSLLRARGIRVPALSARADEESGLELETDCHRF